LTSIVVWPVCWERGYHSDSTPIYIKRLFILLAKLIIDMSINNMKYQGNSMVDNYFDLYHSFYYFQKRADSSHPREVLFRWLTRLYSPINQNILTPFQDVIHLHYLCITTVNIIYRSRRRSNASWLRRKDGVFFLYYITASKADNSMG
jgi:hypothetical protein